MFVWIFITMYVILAVLDICCWVGFLWLRCAGAALQCSVQASHCGSFLVQSRGSRVHGFTSCSRWAQWLWLLGSRVQAQYLQRTGLVALQHVGSSWTRDWTSVSCVGRWILYHWATREAPVWCFDLVLCCFKKMVLKRSHMNILWFFFKVDKLKPSLKNFISALFW